MLSYSSFYIPGYTGFIPNLESIIGETYGNATRKLIARQAKLLRLSHSAAGTPEHKNLLRHHYTQQGEGRNTEYEYPPMKTNHHLFTRRLIYDCDPSTAAAVQAIERAKADLKSPPKPENTRQLTLTMPGDKTVMISSSATPDLPSGKKILGTTILESARVQKAEDAQTSTPKKRDAIQKNLRRPIYRADRGLPPSYTGYIPGHKFSFGKTWGVSTRNSLEAGKRRPFEWTSHMLGGILATFRRGHTRHFQAGVLDLCSEKSRSQGHQPEDDECDFVKTLPRYPQAYTGKDPKTRRLAYLYP